MKECYKCKQTKSNDEFHFASKSKGDKLKTWCIVCERLHRREYLKRVGNVSYHNYEKTHKGFLMRLYRNMKSRVSGIQKKCIHLYYGKELLPKDDFYSWANSCPEFYRIFDKYQKSGYDRKEAPTVDRIDPLKGYSIDNMRWLTHSENSRLGSINNPTKMPIEVFKDGNSLGSFKSIGEAAKATGIEYFSLYNRVSGIVKNGSRGLKCNNM
jgi:hypothetical protein